MLSHIEEKNVKKYSDLLFPRREDTAVFIMLLI